MANTPHELFSVPGTLNFIEPAEGKLIKTQVWTSERRKLRGKDAEYLRNPTIVAKVRFDDECGNRHMSFSVTGSYGNDDEGGGGCIHDMIEKYFPELKHLIKWHLMDTDGPMHYIGNVTYHAGDLDCWGLKKGMPRAWSQGIRFGSSPITNKLSDSFAEWLKAVLKFREETPASNPDRPSLEVVEVPHVKKDSSYDFSPNYTLGEYGGGVWHKCPFSTRQEAEEFSSALLGSYVFTKTPTLFGEGKERNLVAARKIAVWPEATDEQLSLPRDELTELLKARLPGLISDFKRDVADCGFKWMDGQREVKS